jgi:DNA-binding response OmpR family regulator
MPLPIVSSSVSVKNLLIVDAEVSARTVLAQHLQRRGYHIQEAGSAAEALAAVEVGALDLMVLDAALPASGAAGLGGIEVMRRTREFSRNLPIVVLTAHASVESAIAAVKVGVVDYMLKPCKPDDVELTITRALEERAQRQRYDHLLNMVGEAIDALRQPAVPSEPQIPVLPVPVPPEPDEIADLRVGSLSLDCQKRVLTIKTSPPRTVELTEGEVSILVTLMEKPNQVFTYKQLAEHALGYENMDKWTVESLIRSTVFRLRHKIETGPDSPRVICTVRGRGYYLSPV